MQEFVYIHESKRSIVKHINMGEFLWHNVEWKKATEDFSQYCILFENWKTSNIEQNSVYIDNKKQQNEKHSG